jgi:voltage-gated potassium channel
MRLSCPATLAQTAGSAPAVCAGRPEAPPPRGFPLLPLAGTREMRDMPKNLMETKAAASLLVVLIIFSVISFSIETLPGVAPSVLRFLEVAEAVVVGIFTLEYGYRLYVAEDRRRFAFSFFGLVDLLAILPFYLAFAIDLRALRMVRLLRLLRLFKLARYSAALNRMTRALGAAKEELIISTFMLAVFLYFAAFGIFHFEHAAQPDKFATIFDALWWAVATVTTVGYGDIYPVTFAGRFFTLVVLIAGLGLVAVPAGIFASALFSVKAESGKETVPAAGIAVPEKSPVE